MKKKWQKPKEEIVIEKDNVNGIRTYYNFVGSFEGFELSFKDVTGVPFKVCLSDSVVKKMILNSLKHRKAIKAIHTYGNQKAFIGGKGR